MRKARKLPYSIASGARFLATLLVCLAAAGEVYPQVGDGFDPGANGEVFAVALQQDGKIVVGGSFTAIGGGGNGNTPRSRIARLNHDGTVDPIFTTEVNGGPVLALAEVPNLQDFIVGGDFSSVGGGNLGVPLTRNKIARIDRGGNLNAVFNPGANGSISAILCLPDGKILIGGSFTMVGGGGTGTVARSRIARLDGDGSLDTNFDPGANGTILGFVPQKDGKIIVIGNFTTFGGGGTGTAQRRFIARMNPDGSLDSTFDPGADNTIQAAAVQTDGKIVVGGNFNGLGGGTGTTTRNFIGRINVDGTVDATFNPGADFFVSALALQPDGGILVGGFFQKLGGGGTGTTNRSHIGRLRPDGSVDDFNPGTTGLIHAFAIQVDRKIIVGGAFGSMGLLTSRANIARLYPDGTPDRTLFLLPNAEVFAVALQADGKILIGGKFSTIGDTFRAGLARINPDGRLDESFKVRALGASPTSGVYAIAVQPDGKIVIGGEFSSVNELDSGGVNIPRNNIARINPNGTIDMSFDPGANDVVRSLTIQLDGKIVAGGSFTALGNSGTTPRNRIGRLNSDGTIDNSFDPGANNRVRTLAVQRDGKILLGGDFTMVGGGGTGTIARNFIARLNSDGSLDTAFDPGANGPVSAFALHRVDFILVAGEFTMLGGGGLGTTTRNRIGALTSNGSLGAFLTAVPGANGPVKTVALQADGKLIVGGSFTTLGEGAGTKNRNKIGRFNIDGTVDDSFNPSTTGDDAVVNGLALQSDGKVLVGGNFATVGSIGPNIGRLNNTGPAAQLLFADRTAIMWFNGGTGPEAARVIFEFSTDGVNFTFLGTPSLAFGIQVPASVAGFGVPWLLGGLDLPLNQRLFIRARGFYQTGQETASFSILESVNAALFCPAISISPVGGPFGVPVAGVAGIPYSVQFTQTGATGPITFTKLQGVLPPGLVLSPGGLLSGTPTQAGNFPFTLEASDQNGCFGTRDYGVRIGQTGIQFAQSAISAAEGVNALTITVNRIGNTTGEASVNFATSDTAGLSNCTVANGKASERCDYGTAVGTLRFAAGETSKSFTIPIVNDALVEGNETFNVTLSNDVTGALIVEPQTTVITIVDDDTAPATSNPIDNIPFFVTQQYIDFLGRLPDTIGFQNWVATLTGCPNGGFGENDNPGCDRVHVSAGFFLSVEFQGRGYFAYRFYEVGLNRRPKYAEFVPDMVLVGGEQSPEQEALSKAAYTQAFTQREEFRTWSQEQDNAGYVNILEANAEVTLANKAELIAALNSGQKSRATVLREIVETSAVADRFFNRAFVAMQYFGYLRRDPDSIGFQNWLNTLNADPNNFRHMIFGFIYSTEYRQRFGP